MKTTPAERGITLSGKLPLLARNGTKTQTRRLMKPQPPDTTNVMMETFRAAGVFWAGNQKNLPDSGIVHSQSLTTNVAYGSSWRCPYGPIGARLYVREDHYQFGHWQPVPSQRTKLGRQKWAFVADSEEVRFEAPEGLRKGRHHKDSATPAWHKRLGKWPPIRALMPISPPTPRR